MKKLVKWRKTNFCVNHTRLPVTWLIVRFSKSVRSYFLTSDVGPHVKYTRPHAEGSFCRKKGSIIKFFKNWSEEL